VINCPSNITVNATAGLCGATVSYTAAAIPASTITYSIAPGSFFPAGTTTVTATAINAVGSSSCTFTVTVVDNQFPVLTYVPANISVVCNAPVTPSATGMATGTDNCAAPTISYTDVVSSNGLQITRTWKAIDASGNFVTGVQVIIILPLSVSIASVPTSNVYTGGVTTSLYIGYGAQSTALQVNTSSQPAAGAPYSYGWSGANLSQLSNTNSSAPVFTVGNTSGYYTYTVTVTNRYGCSKSAIISICVTDVRVAGSNGKVYVCHLPPGNPGNRQTLSISVNAVDAHLANHTGDRLGSCDQSPCNTTAINAITGTTLTATKESGETIATSEEELKVTVMPNPSTTYFTLKLESRYETPVNMRVMDGRGRVIDAKSKIGANSTIQIGHNYSSGTYYAELIQGTKKRVVQLIKGKG
jgi:PKD repeat protein